MLDRDFLSKSAIGRKVEEQIMLYYRKHIDNRATLLACPIKEYDIKCPKVGNVEVKEDRLAIQTGNYALETQTYDKSPSGVMGTTAGDFVIVDQQNVVFTTTENLRYILKMSEKKHRIKMGYRTPDGRQNEGYLIPIGEILFSPFVSVQPRWFPQWRMINGRIY